MEGTYVSNESEVSSYDIRQQLLKTSQQQLIDNFKNRFTVPVKISDTEIDSLQQTEYPVTIKFNFAFDQGMMISFISTR